MQKGLYPLKLEHLQWILVASRESQGLSHGW